MLFRSDSLRLGPPLDQLVSFSSLHQHAVIVLPEIHNAFSSDVVTAILDLRSLRAYVKVPILFYYSIAFKFILATYE